MTPTKLFHNFPHQSYVVLAFLPVVPRRQCPQYHAQLPPVHGSAGHEVQLVNLDAGVFLIAGYEDGGVEPLDPLL